VEYFLIFCAVANVCALGINVRDIQMKKFTEALMKFFLEISFNADSLWKKISKENSL
jgi:hypothetical protein